MMFYTAQVHIVLCFIHQFLYTKYYNIYSNSQTRSNVILIMVDVVTPVLTHLVLSFVSAMMAIHWIVMDSTALVKLFGILDLI